MVRLLLAILKVSYHTLNTQTHTPTHTHTHTHTHRHEHTLNPQVTHSVFTQCLSEAAVLRATASTIHSRQYRGRKRETIHKNTPVKHTWSLPRSPLHLPVLPCSHTHTDTSTKVPFAALIKGLWDYFCFWLFNSFLWLIATWEWIR